MLGLVPAEGVWSAFVAVMKYPPEEGRGNFPPTYKTRYGLVKKAMRTFAKGRSRPKRVVDELDPDNAMDGGELLECAVAAKVLERAVDMGGSEHSPEQKLILADTKENQEEESKTPQDKPVIESATVGSSNVLLHNSLRYPGRKSGGKTSSDGKKASKAKKQSKSS